MKGILFNLLEDVVVDAYDIDLWDRVIDRAGVHGSYSSVGRYDERELKALVGGLGELCSAARGASDGEMLKWFGVQAMVPLAERYPAFFEPHDHTVDFILTLNDVIHAEVLKLHPDAEVPTFQFSGVRRTGGVSSVTLHYTSGRMMCALAEGFTIGAAGRFGERATVRHRSCMLDGDTECRMDCTFERSAPNVDS